MNFDTNAFLFDCVRHAERQQKVSVGVFIRIEYGALARFAYGGFFYEEGR